MNRTSRSRRTVRDRPRVELLEVRALLSLAGTVVPYSGSDTSNIRVVPPSSPTLSFSTLSNPLTAVEPDGSVILASSSDDDNSGAGYFSVAKLNADGSLDTSFGQGGRETIQVGPDNAVATALVVQPDGTIDVAGRLSGVVTSYSNGDADTVADAAYGVLQLTPEGAVDTSFGTQGIATLPTLTDAQMPLSELEAMALTPTGQLVLAGQVGASSPFSTEFYAARLNSDGTLDTTFGTGGTTLIPVTLNGLTIDQTSAVAVESSGEILLAGEAAKAVHPNLVFVQDFNDSVVLGITTSGTLDPSFGGPSADGAVILPYDPTQPNAEDNRQVIGIALQASGPIVLAETGFSSVSYAEDDDEGVGDLAELNADGTINTSFGTAGTATFTNGLNALGVSVQPDGKILVPGYAVGSAPNYISGSALGRYDSDGVPDPTFGTASTPGLAIYSQDSVDAGALFSTATLDSAGLIVLGGSHSTPLPESGSLVYFQVTAVTSQTTQALSEAPADYDGSGLTNLAVYLPASGEFAYRPTNGGPDVLVPFGIPGVGQTIPAPGDYDGAGKTEIAAYLPSQGIYAYRPADGGPDVLQSFGIAGPGQSIPAPADYFGTGVDDIAVYMPSIAAFGIRNPAGGPDEIVPFGIAGMGQTIPTPGDYFGTGQDDIAAYLPSLGAFAIRNPAGGPDEIIPFGLPGAGMSIPIPGDYDNSGKTELAVYMPSLGEFAYRPANGGPDVIIPFGTAGDGSIPTPGDYTGVGYDEIGLYDPNYADFAYRPANGGADVIEQFGAAGVGASLPLAAPIESNVAPANPVAISAASVATTSASASATIKAMAVPSGPLGSLSAGLVRVASKLPAQADPSKPTT